MHERMRSRRTCDRRDRRMPPIIRNCNRNDHFVAISRAARYRAFGMPRFRRQISFPRLPASNRTRTSGHASREITLSIESECRYRGHPKLPQKGRGIKSCPASRQASSRAPSILLLIPRVVPRNSRSCPLARFHVSILSSRADEKPPRMEQVPPKNGTFPNVRSLFASAASRIRVITRVNFRVRRRLRVPRVLMPRSIRLYHKLLPSLDPVPIRRARGTFGNRFSFVRKETHTERQRERGGGREEGS